ncbi:MAG: hypothetical protein AAF846_27240 [Chloroflexota bacterium]
MRLIRLKNNDLYYIAKSEEIPDTLNDGKMTWKIHKPSDFIKDYLRSSTNMRAIIARTIPDWGFAMVYYVYWYNQDVDLDKLDQTLKYTITEPIEFKYTIVLEYDVISCRFCGSAWHTLLPASSEFAARPVVQHHQFIYRNFEKLVCPNCNGSFDPTVVAILAKWDEVERQERTMSWIGLPTIE